MSLVRISTRYAKSLIEFARESNKLDRIHEDILNLKTACDNRDFMLLCKSPIVPSGKKLQVFKALFENLFDPLSFAFFSLLVKKGREIYMPEVAQEFIRQYDAIRKKTKVVLTSAELLDVGLIEAIKSKLTDSSFTRENVEIETKVDPALIGGFVLEFDDKLYDASVIHQLHIIKKSLASNDSLKTI
ncbi:MAG: ATP synthase F1 subunit delta [Saprospiraceae bacterium]